MDNESSSPAGTAVSTHVVEAAGCFGTVRWQVCEDLFNILPRNERISLLDMAGERVISPFFEGLTGRLLIQVDYSGPPSAQFDRSWSFETRTYGCCYGQSFWDFGQGFWDAMPVDQRDPLLEFSEITIQEFFHMQVSAPLYVYAQRKIRGL